MTRTALLPFAAIKELRALWLAWLAIVVWIVASDVLAFPPLIGMATYFLGAVVLGALPVGHEYSHHTLALLLSQPTRRERLCYAFRLLFLSLALEPYQYPPTTVRRGSVRPVGHGPCHGTAGRKF